MRFLVIIILFISAVIGSVVLAKLALRGVIEAELRERALVALAEAGYDGVEVKFDHLNASLGGYVESPDATEKVVTLLREKLPTAYWPDPAATAITIRPTLAPWLIVTRSAGTNKAKIEGVLAASEGDGRSLLASRLHALPGIGEIENRILLDPRQVPFPKMVEFASLAAGLLAHSEVAEVALKDGKLKIEGTVPNDGIHASLLDLAGGIAAGGTVDQIVVKMPETFLRSADFTLTRNRFGITLNGTLPNEADKAAVIASLKAIEPALTISDRVAVAADRAPASWQRTLPGILPVLLLGLSGEMTAEFSENQVRLLGVASDEATFRTMEAGLAPLGAIEPALEIVADITIAASSTGPGAGQTMLAVYEGGLLVLSGKLSDESLPARIEAELKGLLPDLRVQNEVETIPAAPGHEWVARLPEFFAETLARIKTGTFRFEDNQLSMKGRTLAFSDKQILQNIAVNTVPTNFTIQNDLLHVDAPVPRPPLTPELREALTAALKEFPIYFDAGSEIPETEEKAKVASIVEVVKKANADLSLVVTGVSDHKGNAEKNRELSLKRADSVVAELVSLGLNLTAIETAAVIENVSNVPRSQQGKARRVDVSLKPEGEAAPDPVP